VLAVVALLAAGVMLALKESSRAGAPPTTR
jgi:hypothetical protein